MTRHAPEFTLPFEVPTTDGDELVTPRDDARAPRDGSGGRVERIWIKRAKRGLMDAVTIAVLDPGGGLRGNADRGGRRQVTIISADRWSAICETLRADIPPSTRRANLLVSGLDLEKTRGRMMRIGPGRLRINGETRPCWQMEEAHAGLQAAMSPHWGGGVFAEVVEGGEIRVGDSVVWE